MSVDGNKCYSVMQTRRSRRCSLKSFSGFEIIFTPGFRFDKARAATEIFVEIFRTSRGICKSGQRVRVVWAKNPRINRARPQDYLGIHNQNAQDLYLMYKDGICRRKGLHRVYVAIFTRVHYVYGYINRISGRAT